MVFLACFLPIGAVPMLANIVRPLAYKSVTDIGKYDFLLYRATEVRVFLSGDTFSQMRSLHAMVAVMLAPSLKVSSTTEWL